jgi:hypothetical protein
MSKTLRIIGNVGKVVGAIGLSMLIGETTMSAVERTENDVRAAEALYQYKKDPTPFLVKEKGLFGKKKVVKQNPITGTISDYTGSKAPVNKKPYRI